MRTAKPSHRKRAFIAFGCVAAIAALVAISGSLQPWWDDVMGQGIDETITNDTGHAITWKCTEGNRTMQPGETEMLSFIASPEDFDGCNYADHTQMCLNEYQPDPGQHVTASYAIKEWACT